MKCILINQKYDKTKNYTSEQTLNTWQPIPVMSVFRKFALFCLYKYNDKNSQDSHLKMEWSCFYADKANDSLIKTELEGLIYR